MSNLRVSQLDRLGRGCMRDDHLLLIVDTEEGISRCVTLGDIRDYAKRGPLGHGYRNPKKYFEEPDIKRRSLYERLKRLFFP